MSGNQLIYNKVLSRLKEPRRFILALCGPRQVGKTTLITQILDSFESNQVVGHYASADKPAVQNQDWIEQQWNYARILAQSKPEVILVLDEIQKISQWSSIVKQCWDEDSYQKCNIKLVILGSAPLLIQQGLTESLAGRFEVIRMTHWSFPQMRDSFGFSLSDYIYFGGYPGAASLIKDEARWREYILDALIETTISRDILLLSRVDKPALLRQLFNLGCVYSGQILSFQKMLGQLQDAGNTTTLANYLQLLSQASMLSGLDKYAGSVIRQRASSPKWQVHNTALMSAQASYTFDTAILDQTYWGRLVESTIGSHLMNYLPDKRYSVYYWRSSKQQEVDFILQFGEKLIAIEVKSSAKSNAVPGIQAFKQEFKSAKTLLVGGNGIPISEFLTLSMESLF